MTHALAGLPIYHSRIVAAVDDTLIPAPADCEVRSMIKFLNAQIIASIEIHRQLFQVYGHTRFDGQHISCRSLAGRCLVIHHIARISHLVISIFSYTSINSCPSASAFSEWQAEMSVTVVPIPGSIVLRHRIQKLLPWNDKCLNSGGEYVGK